MAGNDNAYIILLKERFWEMSLLVFLGYSTVNQIKLFFFKVSIKSLSNISEFQYTYLI